MGIIYDTINIYHMKKIKVITCTSNKYVGHTFECSDKCMIIGNLVKVPTITSKPFRVLKIKGKKITLQNSHVTIECIIKEED